MNEPAPPLSVLRPALELAWLVARTGAQTRPPEAAPGRLRPLLRAAKLPDRMLATVQKVVEDDTEFRQRVAKVADEALLGRGAWLWLVRPDGWQEELAEVAAAAVAAQSEADGRRRARDTERQLEEVRAGLARAEAELALLRHRNVQLAEQADVEQRARRRAEADAAARSRELTSARTELAQIRASTIDAHAQLEKLTAAVGLGAEREAALAAERDAALDAVSRLRSELADAGAEALQSAADTQETPGGRRRRARPGCHGGSRSGRGSAGGDPLPGGRLTRCARRAWHLARPGRPTAWVSRRQLRQWIRPLDRSWCRDRHPTAGHG